MKEKVKARLRELAPPEARGSQGRDSRNLAFTFSFTSVEFSKSTLATNPQYSPCLTLSR